MVYRHTRTSNGWALAYSKQTGLTGPRPPVLSCFSVTDFNGMGVDHPSRKRLWYLRLRHSHFKSKKIKLSQDLLSHIGLFCTVQGQEVLTRSFAFWTIFNLVLTIICPKYPQGTCFCLTPLSLQYIIKTFLQEVAHIIPPIQTTCVTLGSQPGAHCSSYVTPPLNWLETFLRKTFYGSFLVAITSVYELAALSCKE